MCVSVNLKLTNFVKKKTTSFFISKIKKEYLNMFYLVYKKKIAISKEKKKNLVFVNNSNENK